MIHPERIQLLNHKKLQKGKYIIYWMQASQRTEYNHALEYAIREANQTNVPLLVYFELIDDFPEANARHYHFMLEGLQEVQASLAKTGIRMVINHASNPAYPDLLHHAKKATLVVTDRGYLRIQRDWRAKYARRLPCPLIQVESDVVVPVEVASSKEEFSAGTFRPKISFHIDHYLMPHKHSKLKHSSFHFKIKTFPLRNIDKAIASLKIDHTIEKSPILRGGMKEAKKHLQNFIKHRLAHFSDFRNDPSKEFLSNMSPYLHFGQISPSYIAREARKSPSKGLRSFLEELIVRRELAINFVYYNPRYDSFDCLHPWARKTLEEHRSDTRKYTYTLTQFEKARTHDPYWNAAQQEMVMTGKMHGYMRMYWGKKLLEWTRTPEEGFKIALYLNNKYELDGRDPNGFAGVAWCFGKHDRAWGERDVFGKIRYMNAEGLKRKFNMNRYLQKIDALKKK